MNTQLPLIPMPPSMRTLSDTPVLIDGLRVEADAGAQGAAGLWREVTRQLEGWRGEGERPGKLRFRVTGEGDEAYRLVVRDGDVELSGTAAGVLQGVGAMRQLLERGPQGWTLPAVEIDDRPKFSWRGVMLDSGRHFFTVDEVLRVIDLASLYRLNRFHWHLTEDQGWRIAMERYPKLTEIGAWRDESPKMGDASAGDGTPYGGYYTAADIRRVVAYAAARGMTVVPEIEMPGHSTAAIAAYPHLGNTDIPDWQNPKVSCRWGVHHNTFSPREETFEFISNVFDEVLPLFPGDWVHIGGDEAPKQQWLASPFAREVMEENHLEDGEALQSWFLCRVEKMLAQRGKKLVGWDEIQEGGLPATATVVVWRDRKWARPALERGNPIVMAVQSNTYFDYTEGQWTDDPAYQTIGGAQWKPCTPVAKTVAFDPMPDDAPAEREHLLLGVQGQVWTEYIWSMDKLEYQMFPRLCALAEIAWSGRIGDEAAFMSHLQRHEQVLERFGVNYRRSDGRPARANAVMTRTPRPRR